MYIFVVNLHISSDLRYSLILSSFIPLLTFFVTSDNKKHWAVWWAWELGDDGVRADDIISSEWATVERRPVQEGGGKTDIYALALFMVIVYCVVDRE